MGEDIIIIWPSGALPTGWLRDTAFDGRFAKGASTGVDPDETGGNSTHSHTSPAHGHTIGAHVHSISLNDSTYGGNSTGSTSSGGPSDNHGHNAVNSGAATGGSLSSVTSTYDSVNSEPIHKEILYIKATGETIIPNLGCVFFMEETLPTGWYDCDGNNSTPDFVDFYLKGASTGNDGSPTTERGASSHVHTITHTHVETAHTHARVQSGSYTRTTQFETASGTADSVQSHSHDLDLDAGTMGYSGTPSSSSKSIEILHKKIRVIQNRTGGYDLPVNAIAMWRGLLGDIPTGWELVTAMEGYYPKPTATFSEVGDVAGSNTHTHSDSHGHNGSTHTHTCTVEFQGVTNNLLNSGKKLPKPHTHTANVGSQSGDWESSATTADSSNHEPYFRTVAFIKYVGEASRIAQSIELEANRPSTTAISVEFDAALSPAQGKYRWIIYDRDTDKNIVDVTDARDKKFSVLLNEESTAQFTLNLTNVLASSEFIDLGTKELHIYRNNTRVWGGELSYYEGDLDTTNEDFTVTARSFESLLRSRYTGAYREFSAIDAGIIGWTLVDESQALTGGDFGIVSGEIMPSVSRTRTYEYKNIYEALVQLSQVQSGFDWEITPYKTFNVYYPSKGSDRSASDILKWGSNIESVRFTNDFSEPVNRAIVLGAGEAAAITYSVRTDTTARALYKLREKVVSYKDVSVQATLDDKGDEVLTQNKDPIFSLGITQARGEGILAFTRLNVGDEVQVEVRHGFVNVYDKYRIQGLNVEIADDGTEKVEYVLTKGTRVSDDIYDVIRGILEQLSIWASTNYAINS